MPEIFTKENKINMKKKPYNFINQNCIILKIKVNSVKANIQQPRNQDPRYIILKKKKLINYKIFSIIN